jgi:hypothetical protein
VLAVFLILGWVAVVLSVVLAVPLLVALVQRPQRGVLLLVALAPLDGLLVLFPHLNLVQYWKEELVILIFGATFLAPSDARGPTGRHRPDWAIALGAFFALAVLSAVFVEGLQAAYGLKLDFFYVLLAIAVWRCPLDRKERDRLVTLLMIMGFVAAAWGILQQLVGPTRLNDLGYAYNTNITFIGSFLRSFATFQSPHAFGLFEMLVILVGVPHALSDLRRLRNRLFLLLLPIYAAGLLLSTARSAFLGLAVGLAYLGWRRHRVLLLLIPAGVVALAFLPAELGSTVLSTTSGHARTATWTNSLPLVSAHPLGQGIGAAGSTQDKIAQGGPLLFSQKAAGDQANQLAGQSANASAIPVADTIPDNYYVKTVLDLGILGLWLFVVMLVSIFFFLQSASKRLVDEPAVLCTAASATVLAGAVAALVATYFEIFPMDLFFWLLVGVASATTADPRSVRLPAERSNDPAHPATAP